MTDQVLPAWVEGLTRFRLNAISGEWVKWDDLVAARPPQVNGWQPIETAPERRKVLVSWVNSHGKRRTAMASYWPEGTIDMADDVPDWQVTEEGKNLDAGWWEESEGNDDAMFRLVETMTHWMPLPDPPPAALPGAVPPQEECAWTFDEHYDYYETACGQAFQLNGGGELRAHRMLFCCYCGTRLHAAARPSAVPAPEEP